MADQSTYPPPTRLLPSSNALSEAEPMSMQELFSRHPETYSDRHIDAIVLNMRDLRIRLEQTATTTRGGRLPAQSRMPRKTKNYLPPGASMKGLLDGPDDEDE